MGCKAQSAANGPCHWQGLQRRRPPKSAPARPRRDREHVLSPAITEEVKYGGLLFSAAHPFCGVFAYARHVSLEFGNGASLPDKYKALEGAGKLRRHIKLTSPRDIANMCASICCWRSRRRRNRETVRRIVQGAARVPAGTSAQQFARMVPCPPRRISAPGRHGPKPSPPTSPHWAPRIVFFAGQTTSQGNFENGFFHRPRQTANLGYRPRAERCLDPGQPGRSRAIFPS
ncbi:MAG: DUF1801 domain-containing protein [Burkholderiaceae bacterium]|nr:DUF1801 domain-containing protein [Burkholderiaceae bacterium]